MKTTKLYRAVSEAEFQDLLESGEFRQGANSLRGKWFAESADDAAQWGKALQGAKNYRIIEVEIPTEIVQRFFKLERLDHIGPAFYGELDELKNVTYREVFI